VTVGTTALDGSNAEIASGISSGDVVVTDGVDKLQDGSKVIVAKANAPGAPAESPQTNAPAAVPPVTGGGA
jgi:multidrug efflux system membrane fusion protein